MGTKKASYNRSLGKKVALAANPEKISKVHVVWENPNEWSVVLAGKNTSYRTSLHKNDAIILALKLASQIEAELVIIHDKLGNVTRRLKVS